MLLRLAILLVVVAVVALSPLFRLTQEQKLLLAVLGILLAKTYDPTPTAAGAATGGGYWCCGAIRNGYIV